MKSITADMTSLHGFDMDPDLILSGERAEFDPEPKPSRKEAYVRHEFAKKLVDAYADDLLLAYRTIEELEAENEALKAEAEEQAKAAEASASQVRQLLKGEQGLADAEKLLAKFEHQLEALANDKRTDKSTIQELSAQVNELLALKETVPQLEEDVNTVLENLRSYFSEAGIDLDMGADYE